MVFLFILSILFLLIVTLKIRIEIRNVNFILKEPLKNQFKSDKAFNINNNYSIKISFKILGFLPIIRVNFTKSIIEKLNKKINFEKINSRFKDFRKSSSLIDTKKNIQNLRIDVKEFYLKAGIGLDSVMLLTYIIPIICTFLSIYLANKKVNIKNQFYQIEPIYNLRKYNKCTI